jgi:hypothetical protein
VPQVGGQTASSAVTATAGPGDGAAGPGGSVLRRGRARGAPAAAAAGRPQYMGRDLPDLPAVARQGSLPAPRPAPGVPPPQAMAGARWIAGPWVLLLLACASGGAGGPAVDGRLRAPGEVGPARRGRQGALGRVITVAGGGIRDLARPRARARRQRAVPGAASALAPASSTPAAAAAAGARGRALAPPPPPPRPRAQFTAAEAAKAYAVFNAQEASKAYAAEWSMEAAAHIASLVVRDQHCKVRRARARPRAGNLGHAGRKARHEGRGRRRGSAGQPAP